jgi:hypothetical protein
MIKFASFQGVVTAINDLPAQNGDNGGCVKIYSVENGTGGVVHFVVSPYTYFVDQAIVAIRDQVTGYYDRNTPVIFIYPPQYQALIFVKNSPYQKVEVDHFNTELLSSDGQLKLNLSPSTPILLRNGQPFTQNPANRNLIVMYSASTKSSPTQATPNNIIVWC